MLERNLPKRYGKIDSVTVLSEKTGDTGEAAEAVYRTQFTDSDNTEQIRYIREVAPERVEPVSRSLALNEDIGIPESELLDTTPALLIMEPAKGRPLSLLLPLFFLPGVWAYKSSGLRKAAENVGRYFGRLHSGTQCDMVRPVDFSRFVKYTRYSKAFSHHLGNDLTTAIDEIISKISNVETPVSCVFSDPTPHNLYYSDSDIDLIDYTFYDHLSLKDVITFERGMELMAERVPHGRQSQADAIIAAFRHGYAESGPDLGIEGLYEYFKIIDYCYVLDRYLNGKLGRDSSPLSERITSHTDIKICTERITQIIN